MNISESKRRDVYRKYKGRCAYCGERIEYKDLHVEHKIPRAKGGGNDISKSIAKLPIL